MKTKLGISTALLAAIAYFMGLFSGYVALAIIVGYILLCESDAWVRKAAVKAVVICIVFSVVVSLLNLVPGLFGIIDDACNIFNGSFNLYVATRIITFLVSILNFTEKLLLLFLGFKALKNQDVAIPELDKFLDKHMN